MADDAIPDAAPKKPLPNLDPDRPFIFTGQPQIFGSVRAQTFRGPDLADSECIPIFVELVGTLRAATAKLRTVEVIRSAEVNAVVQLTALTCVLAGAEAQALLALVTTGHSAPARVHLRSMGEAARRVRAFLHDPQLALRVYRSYVASQTRVAKGFLDDSHDVMIRLNELIEQAAKKTDRDLTSGILKREASSSEMSAMEAEAWSKWSHAEITALAEIARRADQNPTLEVDVVAANDTQGEFYLFRGTLFLWHLLLALIAVGIDLEDYARATYMRIEALAKARGWAQNAT